MLTKCQILSQLVVLFKEQNNRDPTEEEMNQWMSVLKEASLEGAEAVNAANGAEDDPDDADPDDACKQGPPCLKPLDSTSEEEDAKPEPKRKRAKR